MSDNWHYYEAHVTLAPIYTKEEVTRFKQTVCLIHDFRVAELYMDKQGELIPSELDMFCTARSEDLGELTHRLRAFLSNITVLGHKVRRYKVESTLFDSNHNDNFFKL